jgi:hypothetical protein
VFFDGEFLNTSKAIAQQSKTNCAALYSTSHKYWTILTFFVKEKRSSLFCGTISQLYHIDLYLAKESNP